MKISNLAFFVTFLSVLSMALSLQASEEVNGLETTEDWSGTIECLVDDNTVVGSWQFNITEGIVAGEATIPEVGTGIISGYSENEAVYATMFYTCPTTHADTEAEWNGQITEKDGDGAGGATVAEEIRGSTYVSMRNQFAECIWAGEKRITKPVYGNITVTTSNNTMNATYVPICTENCTKIVFIQVICRFAILSDGSERSFKPSQSTPTWAEKDNSTVDGGKWCTVDYVTGEADPYYNGDDPNDVGAKGKHGDSKNSTMFDAPRYPTVSFNNLTSALSADVSKVRLEFEVCAFCAEGADAGKFYGCFRWDYDQEKGKSGTSTNKGLTEGGPSSKFREALDKWADVRGFALPE